MTFSDRNYHLNQLNSTLLRDLTDEKASHITGGSFLVSLNRRNTTSTRKRKTASLFIYDMNGNIN